MLFISGLDVRVLFVGSQPPSLMDPAGQRKRSLALADSGLGSSKGYGPSFPSKPNMVTWKMDEDGPFVDH